MHFNINTIIKNVDEHTNGIRYFSKPSKSVYYTMRIFNYLIEAFKTDFTYYGVNPIKITSLGNFI